MGSHNLIGKSEHSNYNEDPSYRIIQKSMSCKEQQQEESVENYFDIMKDRHNDIPSVGTISDFNESVVSEVKFGNKSKAEEDSSLMHIFEEPFSPPGRNLITLKRLMRDSSILYLDPEQTNSLNANNNSNDNKNVWLRENSKDN